VAARRARPGRGAARVVGPLVLVVAVAGTDSVLAQEAVFFTVMALVTFGGAYAVLAYVNQAAVSRFGWLTSSEMAVGLRPRRDHPGPLILSVVFVGFVRRAPVARLARSMGGRRRGGARDRLGDLRAELPVDLPRGSIR